MASAARHTWSIVSRTQLFASAAAPTASTSTSGPSASSSGPGALLDAGGLLRHPDRVARPGNQQRLHVGQAWRRQRLEHLTELAAREPLDLEKIGGARSRRSGTASVWATTAKIRFSVRRGSTSDENALFRITSSMAAAGNPSSRRTTLPKGPAKVGGG